MMAITKNMNKSLRCTQLALQNQMHNFAIGTVGKNRSKRGGVIQLQLQQIQIKKKSYPGGI